LDCPRPDLVKRAKQWGSKVLSSATTVEEALWLEQRGVDAIIAQGFEAGGHRGIFLSEDLTTQAGTFALLPQIARAVRCRYRCRRHRRCQGVAAAMTLGARGCSARNGVPALPGGDDQCVHRAALQSDRAAHTA